MTVRQSKKVLRKQCHTRPVRAVYRRTTFRRADAKQLRIYDRWLASGRRLTPGCREGRWDPVRAGRPAARPTPATEETTT